MPKCECLHPRKVYRCGKMTLAGTYSPAHPCEKEVARAGQVCAHHARLTTPSRRKHK